MSKLRLDRLLSNLGYGSRTDAAKWVAAQRIKAAGVTVRDAGASFSLEAIRQGGVTFDDEPLDPPTPFTLMLNKPSGYICSHDEIGRLVYDLLPQRMAYRKPALSCAGRLDKDSSGQVILTDNGQLLHRIIHPKSHAAKHYHVTLRTPLSGDESQLFASGSFLMKGDAKPLKPAQWTVAGAQSGIMILQEGRYHQIRRMFETIGNEVVKLHRFQTGGLPLAELPEGQYRILTLDDTKAIFNPSSDAT